MEDIYIKLVSNKKINWYNNLFFVWRYFSSTTWRVKMQYWTILYRISKSTKHLKSQNLSATLCILQKYAFVYFYTGLMHIWMSLAIKNIQKIINIIVQKNVVGLSHVVSTRKCYESNLIIWTGIKERVEWLSVWKHL